MQILNWKGYLAASLAAAVITAAVCVWWAGRHYQPTIDNLNRDLGSCSTARQAAENTVTFQNGKIGLLEEESKKRKKDGDGKQESAASAAREDYANAQGVLTEQVDMSNECRSAQEAFKRELETERAK
ncbi:hypothetical protein MA12_gp08 [Pectobacterium phage MA12]|uniref:Uncharacterized protein n=1 Tax=Pectobacterium phage MA12 TaxID=2686474 RepID=A0A6B9RPX7_9CAUD|nr:hypothetical protein JT356_gp31 [Pectobacterium phage MA11]YP_010000230.1 hypothetical protein JT357_gp08 [Pectobacterium phage MA12]QGF21055.1 hypothetical protein MA11_gp31 [Pectobacterium phage MA11]QHI00835.1 hypothetical protein MA12_gp08 [Pectobacterium phage MA12]